MINEIKNLCFSLNLSFAESFCTFCKSGENLHGQLGVGDTEARGAGSNEMGDDLDFVEFGDNFTPIHLTAGYTFNCALSLENAIKCWGELSTLID